MRSRFGAVTLLYGTSRVRAGGLSLALLNDPCRGTTAYRLRSRAPISGSRSIYRRYAEVTETGRLGPSGSNKTVLQSFKISSSNKVTYYKVADAMRNSFCGEL